MSWWAHCTSIPTAPHSPCPHCPDVTGKVFTSTLSSSKTSPFRTRSRFFPYATASSTKSIRKVATPPPPSPWWPLHSLRPSAFGRAFDLACAAGFPRFGSWDKPSILDTGNILPDSPPSTIRPPLGAIPPSAGVALAQSKAKDTQEREREEVRRTFERGRGFEDDAEFFPFFGKEEESEVEEGEVKEEKGVGKGKGLRGDAADFVPCPSFAASEGDGETRAALRPEAEEFVPRPSVAASEEDGETRPALRPEVQDFVPLLLSSNDSSESNESSGSTHLTGSAASNESPESTDSTEASAQQQQQQQQQQEGDASHLLSSPIFGWNEDFTAGYTAGWLEGYRVAFEMMQLTSSSGESSSNGTAEAHTE